MAPLWYLLPLGIPIGRWWGCWGERGGGDGGESLDAHCFLFFLQKKSFFNSFLIFSSRRLSKRIIPLILPKKKKLQTGLVKRFVYPSSSCSNLAGGGGWDMNWKERLGGGQLSLLVLATVAPAVHGVVGQERLIHPAHQGRTQHRKTGRKQGYSLWKHCLSV